MGALATAVGAAQANDTTDRIRIKARIGFITFSFILSTEEIEVISSFQVIDSSSFPAADLGLGKGESCRRVPV
jgi:hypothetical protein